MNFANETDTDWNYSIYFQILTGLILYLLTIWTIIGNIFILIAISTNKQLKQNGTSNILIGNLAFSDLLLGLTVLPFSATFDTFKIWTFGQLICDIWLSIDVLCCTASIWGLLMIALDRYIATNHPIKYRLQKKNSKIGLAYCSISWLISILISLGPLAFYNKEQEDSYLNEETNILSLGKQQNRLSGFKKINGTTDFKCVLFHKPSFVVLSSIGSFYLPLILMIILYSKVFVKIRNQSAFRNINLSQRRSDRRTSENNNKSELNEPLNDCKTMSKQFNSETRITKILSIIITCFVACWLPFFIIYIIRSLLPDPNQISDTAMIIFIWLGYLNSALNPVLYLILNSNFRDSFINILKFKFYQADEQPQYSVRRTSRF